MTTKAIIDLTNYPQNWEKVDIYCIWPHLKFFSPPPTVLGWLWPCLNPPLSPSTWKS